MQIATETNQTKSMQVRGDFVLLRADSLRLLLPQHDVNATEYLEHAPTPTGEPGVFSIGMGDGQQHQVVALSEQMKMLTTFPASRFLLTRLSGDREQISLAWNEMKVMIDTALELRPIPPILRGTAGLVDAYVELDGEIAFCTTANRVLAEAQISDLPAASEAGVPN